MAWQLTEHQLAALRPRVHRPRQWLETLNAAMARFRIDTPPRAAAFLAQVAYESQGFRRLAENLSYSAARLMEVWPRRFPSLARAAPYAHDPRKLANRVYAMRLGNGSVSSGDGWRYRGRGLIQLTGRGNYRAAGDALGLPLEEEPWLAARGEVAALVAAWFWASRGLNELADDRSDDDDDADFVRITAIISGGRSGLEGRRTRWESAKAALGVGTAAAHNGSERGSGRRAA